MSYESPSTPTGRRRNHALWIGPLVTLAGLISYFLVFARWPVLRDFPWVNLPLVLAGAAVSVVGFWRAFFRSALWRGKVLGTLGLVFSLLVAGLFNVYVFVFSSMLPETTRLTLELAQAPEIALPDQQGRLVRLTDLRGRKVIVTFFRGFW